MYNDNKIKLILYKAQENASCHQRYLKSLEAYYNQVPFEAFVEEFLKLLKHIFHKYITTRNPYVERTLEFLAQFVSFVTKSNENDTTSQDEDSSSHPFLTEVIVETLKFHDLIYEQARYYSCRFVTLILQHVGNEIHLDNFMCDAIQEAMLQRIMDPKISIRLQAVMALVRLQEPSNTECPVVKAYISLLVEANPLIRKEVVKRIAPNSVTISKISERIRDVDGHVRVAAYSRCADIGPRLFKIITRQQILQCGFNDDSEQVRTVFLEKLFPKWLSAYNDNFLEFLRSLKLDADENDIINTQKISEKVMEVFFSISTIKNIIDVLPIHNEKLVPLNNLTSEVVAYWCIVTRFLRNCPETEDYLDSILPELTPFCCYIERIINFKTSRTLEEWEYMEYQYILYNLLDIAEHYDFSDEIGRKTLYKLITTILQNHKLLFKVAKKIVGILDKLISNVDRLTHEICQIISDIREPLVDKPTTRCGNTNREFQVAELKVKINILQGEIEDALNIQDFQKAAVIQSEIVEYRGKLDDIQKESQIVKVKISKDDPETISRCLDLLSALMELSSVKMLSPSLATCRTEFLLPLLSSNNVEINWRVLKCIALYCILDKNIAAEHARVLCIPIITYRAIPNYNKFALMQSVATICDLVRIYGPELFGSEKDTNSSSSTLHNATKRRLYRNETVDDVNVMDNDRLNVDVIIEIILDMLDDENADIREIAVTALSKLILNEFPVNSSLICRIILKWFNPLEKSVDKSQQKLGFLISNFTKLIKGAREVIEKAVVPIISSIANAPRTSPLADVEIDNVIQFLSALTNSNGTTEVVHIHTDLANLLCYNIANKPKDLTVPYLTKILLHLEIPPEKTVAIRELLTQVELLLEDKEDDIDKGPKKNLKKFAEKLRAALKYQTGKNPTENEVEQQNNLLAQNKSFQNTNEKTQETQQVNVHILNKSRENSAKNTSAAISRNDDKTFVDSTCSIEGGKSERLFSSRLKTIERRKAKDGKNRINKKNVQNDAYPNKDVTKKIDKLSNTAFNQESNNKSRNNLEILRKETNTNKNENGGFQSVKHTNKKRGDVKNCEPKSKKGVTDVESDSAVTDNEADGRKILRRSKRQKTYLKSTDSKKQKVSEVNRTQNLTVDSDQDKVSNTNSNNLGSTACTLLRNNFPDKSLVEGVHGVKRKKLRRRKGQNSLESEEKKLQNSIASEETILYTIMDNSKQASELTNETSESKSSEYSSYSIDRTQRNNIISETSSESESTSSSPVKRPVGKIKKK
ncbi:condensin complex subunit 3 isoform X1 [Anoplophora glabripennis]|nr:condensin complex subunit 3 isoform X1 [Anoplophora glabripennis]